MEVYVKYLIHIYCYPSLFMPLPQDVSLSFDAKVVTHLITGKKLPQGGDTSVFTSNITSSLGSEELNKAK